MNRPPRVSASALRWFARYNRFYLRRHFSAVRVSGLDRLTPAVVEDPAPLVVYLTHAAWWDPLVGVLLATGPLAGRRHRAVIDARALERYALLERLGFVGLDREGAQGARSLLRLVDTLSTTERATLWLTPQGRFTDPRVRPVRLASGLAHIARRLPAARFLPMAIEYPMGGERLPEVRVSLGEPATLARLVATPDGAGAAASERAAARAAAPAAALAPMPRAEPGLALLTERFAARLTAVADDLAENVMHERDTDATTVLDGTHGVSAIYDAGRRVRARLAGRRFEARHGGNLPSR